MGRIVDQIIDMHMNGYSIKKISRTLQVNINDVREIINNFDKEVLS